MCPIEKYIKTTRNKTEEISLFFKREISSLPSESKFAFAELAALQEELFLPEEPELLGLFSFNERPELFRLAS